jgi:hypothetical protein
MSEQTIEGFRKKIFELEEKLTFFEKDASKRGYFALVRIVNQQIDYLNSFVIKSNVGGKASEDATFARTKDMWENLPKMISALSDLKSQLRITSDDEKENDPFGKRITTPETISDVLGNTAGKQD